MTLPSLKNAWHNYRVQASEAGTYLEATNWSGIETSYVFEVKTNKLLFKNIDVEKITTTDIHCKYISEGMTFRYDIKFGENLSWFLGNSVISDYPVFFKVCKYVNKNREH